MRNANFFLKSVSVWGIYDVPDQHAGSVIVIEIFTLQMCLIQASRFQTAWKTTYQHTNRLTNTSIWVTYIHAVGPYMPYFHRKLDQKDIACICASSVFISLVLPCHKTESDDCKGLTGPKSGLSSLLIPPPPTSLSCWNYDQIIWTIYEVMSFYVFVPTAMPCTSICHRYIYTA